MTTQKLTMKQLDARIDEMAANMDKLCNVVAQMALTMQEQQAKPAKQDKPAKPWLTDCPDYATDAQRIEYDKLAKIAREQRQAIMDATGSQAVRAFIPVPKNDIQRMPHSIKWTVTY